ncbi:hypothetical protein N0011_30855, partial [Pseudomonas aeruginosa]|nr:hypothetical protein [Pseudomonas aeruginosa]MCS9649282.1 hypothetical protein [Pseudomonas aeruginosa]
MHPQYCAQLLYGSVCSGIDPASPTRPDSPALAAGLSFGSSHFAGKRRFDFEEEVGVIPVAVG